MVVQWLITTLECSLSVVFLAKLAAIEGRSTSGIAVGLAEDSIPLIESDYELPGVSIHYYVGVVDLADGVDKSALQR